MSKDHKNQMEQIPDPYAGDGYVLSNTKCTSERRQFFKRINEIHLLLFITKLSYQETHNIYQGRIEQFPEKENTPIKIEIPDGVSTIFPAKFILGVTNNGINIIARQTFIMFYGSFETYLFHLLEQTFPQIDVDDDILNRSKQILMGGKWDAKFNKMSETFDLDFKAGELNQHFDGFELHFQENKFKNPLYFLDEIADVRHRIVHASSILESDQLINVPMTIFHQFYCFYFLLTDFVDSLFSKRFDYPRSEINPAKP